MRHTPGQEESGLGMSLDPRYHLAEQHRLPPRRGYAAGGVQ